MRYQNLTEKEEETLFWEKETIDIRRKYRVRVTRCSLVKFCKKDSVLSLD